MTDRRATKRTVLVVEDDEDLRVMVVTLLETEGYVVRVAGDGIEALEQLEIALPDLILLDMRMPKMNGWEFSKRLRTLHGHEIPVVVMTAAEQAEKRAKEIEAEDFVAKPFDIDNLMAIVTRRLPP